MGMFLSFEEWRQRNVDLEETVREEVSREDLTDECECVTFHPNSKPNPVCWECDGSGVTESDTIEAATARAMRLRYEQQLERDYRLAVKAIA